MKPVSTTKFVMALAFRIANAVISRSFFQPDEYWQSLEVAHLWVFGYGWKTWEWRTVAADLVNGSSRRAWSSVLNDGGNGGIRSPLSVLPSAILYEILRLARLDNRGEWLILAPRLVQAFMAASTDVAVAGLAEIVLGREYLNAALIASLTSFFNFFTSTRTFSNSTETALTVWALYYWPWDSYRSAPPVDKDAQDEGKLTTVKQSRESLGAALGFAALASIIRPSNAIIWLILGARLFLRSSSRRQISILITAFTVFVSAIVVSLVLDTLFYQTPTFTPLRFVSTNVFRSIALFYGSNAWHFYLSQGVPLLLLTQLPLFLDGMRQMYRTNSTLSMANASAQKELGWTALGTIASYSLLSHKEWRFLQPILPILHLFVAASLVSACVAPSRSPSRPSHALVHPFKSLAVRSRVRLSHLVLVGASLAPATYLTAFHTRGQNDVMSYLRDELRSSPRRQTRRIKSVGFAMPCHSTPWQSHLHSPELAQEGRLWFITCEPPISGQPRESYRDQSDHFYESPSTYFLTRFPRSVDPAFPPSIVSARSSDPFSRSLPQYDPDFDLSKDENENDNDNDRDGLVERARRRVENPFDLGWTYSAWPSHLVVFGALLDTPCTPLVGVGVGVGPPCETVGQWLIDELGYRVEKKFWNGIRGWHEDERRKGGVVVLGWRGVGWGKRLSGTDGETKGIMGG